MGETELRRANGHRILSMVSSLLTEQIGDGNAPPCSIVHESCRSHLQCHRPELRKEINKRTALQAFESTVTVRTIDSRSQKSKRETH